MALVTTPGASDTDSYCSLIECELYFSAQRLHGSSWALLDKLQQEAACRWATRYLDEVMDWYGWPTNPTVQALMFPQEGQYDKMGNYIASNVIPNILKYATAELARIFGKSDWVASGGDIQSVKIGSTTIQSANLRKTLIPDSLLRMLRPLGVLADANTAKLVRC